MKKIILIVIAFFVFILSSCGTEDNADFIKDVNEMADMLKESFYTQSFESSLGQFDPSAVGIDREAFDNEILYVFPDDSDFETVINVSEEYGFGEDKTGAENSKALEKAIFAAKKGSGLKKIVIPSGTFHLSQAVNCSRAKNYYICGSGDTTLIYDGQSSAFIFDHCEEMHLSGVNITYSDHTWLKGTVIEYYPETYNVKIQLDSAADLDYEGYTDVLRGYYTMCKIDDTGRDYMDYDRLCRYYYGDTVVSKDNEKKTLTVHFFHEANALNAVPEPGEEVTVVLDETSTPGIDVEYCKNTYIENVSLSNTFGMVLVSQWSENLYINRLNVLPSEGDLLSSHWDGIHTCFLRGELVLTNSRIEATQDDPVNICTMYETVGSLSGNKLIIDTDITGAAVGDLLEFYDPANWELKGSAIVTERNGSEITLDREISGVQPGFLVGDDNTAAHLTIRNCLIGNCLGRCLIQTRSTVIEGNTFYRMRGCPVRCHSVSDIFHEGLVPKNMTIKNNKIISCNSTRDYNGAIEVAVYVYETGVTTTGVVSDVTIENNFVCDTPGIGVALYGVTNARVANNFFSNILSEEDNFPKEKLSFYNNLTGNMNGPSLHGSCIGLMYCDGVEITGNYVSAKRLKKADLVKIDKDTVDNITDTDNILVS